MSWGDAHHTLCAVLVGLEFAWLVTVVVAPAISYERTRLLQLHLFAGTVLTASSAFLNPSLLEHEKLYGVVYSIETPLEALTAFFAAAEAMSNALWRKRILAVVGGIAVVTAFVSALWMDAFPLVAKAGADGVTNLQRHDRLTAICYLVIFLVSVTPLFLRLVRLDDWLRDNQARSRIVLMMLAATMATRMVFMLRLGQAADAAFTAMVVVVKATTWCHYLVEALRANQRTVKE